MKTQTQSNEPVTLYSDQVVITEMADKLEGLLPLASTLLTEYNNLAFAKPDATLHYIATETAIDEKTYLLSLIPDTFTLNGLKINKEAAILSRLFQTPEHQAFDTALFNYSNSELPSLEKFFFIEDNEVVINPEELKLFTDQHSIIASTPDEIAMFQVWTEFMISVQTLDVFMRSNCDHPVLGPGATPLQIQSFLSFSGGQLSLNHKAFQMYSKRLTKFN